MNSALTLAATALLGISAATAQEAVPGDPSIPVGKLTVKREDARTGSEPHISWEISYPEDVTDLVEIGPEDELAPKRRSLMEVRMVGADFQVGSTPTVLTLDVKTGGPGTAGVAGSPPATRSRRPPPPKPSSTATRCHATSGLSIGTPSKATSNNTSRRRTPSPSASVMSSTSSNFARMIRRPPTMTCRTLLLL